MMSLGKSLTLICISVFSAGCIDWVDDQQDLVQFVNKAKSTPAGRIEPLPEFKPYHSFVYEGSSMREPFIELVLAAPDDKEADAPAMDEGLQPNLDRKKAYLESFAVDQLKMVGTILKKEDDSLWALVKDSNSEIHRVGLGDYMGLDFGQVVGVNEQGIVLAEIVTNGRGGWIKRSRNLVLSEQE